MRAVLLLLALLVPLGARAQAIPAAPRVLVLEVEPGQGVTKDVAEIAGSLLIGRLRQVPGIVVISIREVEGAMTNEQRTMMAGCDEVSCAAEIAGALSAEQFIMSKLGRLGTQYVLFISRVEQRTARAIHTSTRQFPATGEEAIALQIPEAVKELFPEPAPPPPGASSVVTAQPGPVQVLPQQPQTIIIQQPAAAERSASSRVLSTSLRGIGAVLSGAGLLLFFVGAVAAVAGASLAGLYGYAFYVLRNNQLAFGLAQTGPLMALLIVGGGGVGLLSVVTTALGVLMLVGGTLLE